ncbi:MULTISPECIES: hypothetical protein [Streptomyces]|uniref:Uncharacterized protein n=1 Tax=Streptomyces cadmiisoli TaxID=2184053 RepID=A0A2Z4IYN9_9ACTN|nr:MULTISPECIES: hypothetical protein [Streptomyces]AWW37907.1 hypothetical protein DN051_15675 [Streptomyces cadmiisoli]KOV50594.1 hypothetical protein ADL00_43470 [Streptomyces sp. AS58]
MAAIKFLISLFALPIAVGISALIILVCLAGATAGLVLGVPFMALGAVFGAKGDGGISEWIGNCLNSAVGGPVTVFSTIYGNIWD